VQKKSFCFELKKKYIQKMEFNINDDDNDNDNNTDINDIINKMNSNKSIILHAADYSSYSSPSIITSNNNNNNNNNSIVVMNGFRYNCSNDILTNVQTGDILLLSGKGTLSKIVRLFCPNQPFSHVGIVVIKRDWKHWHPGQPLPSYNPKTDVYLLESSFDQQTLCHFTGIYKYGAKLSNLYDKLQTYDANCISHRKLRFIGDNNPNCFRDTQYLFSEKILKFMDRTIDTTYERNIMEMIQSTRNSNRTDNSSYFCTEYTIEAMRALDIICKDDEKPSNNYTMYDFQDRGQIRLSNRYFYEFERKLSFNND